MALTASLLIAVIGGRMTSVSTLSIGIAALSGILQRLDGRGAFDGILLAGFGRPGLPDDIVVLTNLSHAPGKAASIGTVMGGIGDGIIRGCRASCWNAPARKSA